MRRGTGFKYSVTLPDTLKLYQERYEETNNPVHLFQAFSCAYENDVKPPEWLSDKIYDVFAEWMKTGQSLDILFKTKERGQGKTSPYKEKELSERDLPIMEAINIFMRYKKMTADEAAHKAVDTFRFLAPPSAEQALKLYYRDKWNKKLSDVQYPDGMVESLLNYDENAKPENKQKQIDDIKNDFSLD
jgi:hypothetical protein